MKKYLFLFLMLSSSSAILPSGNVSDNITSLTTTGSCISTGLAGCCPGCDLTGLTVTKTGNSWVVDCQGCGLESPITLTSFKLDDLTGATLNYVVLKNLDLTNVKMPDANLIGADLSGSTLSNANFSASDMTGINLSNVLNANANFSNASIYGADLSGGNFTNANFQCAGIGTSNLTGANFTNTNLTSLVQSIKVDALPSIRQLTSPKIDISVPQDLRTSINSSGQAGFLNNVNFTKANLAGLYFSGLDLTGSNFTAANLTNAHLDNTNVTNVNFNCASLMNTNTSGTKGIPANVVGLNLSSGNSQQIPAELDQNGTISFTFDPNAQVPDLIGLQVVRTRLAEGVCLGSVTAPANTYIKESNCNRNLINQCSMKGASWAKWWNQLLTDPFNGANLIKNNNWWVPQADTGAQSQSLSCPS